jgi:hypothetical protein
MSPSVQPDTARAQWAALGACLLDFEAFPGRYPLALREPRLLFDHGTEVLILASGRPAEGLPQDEALQVQLRKAARFFVRTAMLRPGADHYTLLGLKPAFDSATLRDHYRMLMRLTHPDFSGGGRFWPADAATRINQANDVFSSPMGRQNYDRTLGGSKHPAWQPPHGDAAALARPQATPTSHPRSGTSSPVWRRAAMGALLASGVFGAGIWLFSGAPEPDHGVMQVQVSPPVQAPSETVLAAASGAAVAPAAMAPGSDPVVAQQAAPPPASLPVADAEGRMPEPPEAKVAARQTADPDRVRYKPGAPLAQAGWASRTVAPAPSGGLEVRPVPGVDAAPAPAPSTALPQVPAVAMPAAVTSLQPAGSGLAAAVTQASPQPARAGATTVAVNEAAPLAGRLGMEDVQPLLGQVLGVLQSGRGEQVLRWVERPVRPGDGADGFVLAYNRAVVNARAVRLGTVRFSGRPVGDGLQVDGLVTLHLQDEYQQASTRELVLRAQFAARGGQAVLTRLNASEMTR